MPVPASRSNQRPSCAGTATQDVLPPTVENSTPAAGLEPRMPHRSAFTRAGCSLIPATYR